MKATGIVRRIDDLGRVVIPKEIRRTYRIRVGDPLEIFTDRDGQIVFKKYSPIAELSDYAQEYVNTLKEALECDAYVCDKDVILAGSGGKNSEYNDAYISKDMIKAIEGREVIVATDNDIIEVIEREDISGVKGQVICPIILEGDPIGSIILASKEKTFTDADVKVAKTVALLLEKQMEC